MRDFNEWLAGFRDSIADYGYYIDFEKVHRNVGSIYRTMSDTAISESRQVMKITTMIFSAMMNQGYK